MPVCFALVGAAVYTVVDEKPKRTLALKRLGNIVENPRAALVVDRYDDVDWSALGWVLLRGSASVLTGGAEHARALAALRRRYPQYAAMALADRPVTALHIERVASWGTLR